MATMLPEPIIHDLGTICILSTIYMIQRCVGPKRMLPSTVQDNKTVYCRNKSVLLYSITLLPSTQIIIIVHVICLRACDATSGFTLLETEKS